MTFGAQIGWGIVNAERYNLGARRWCLRGSPMC